MYEIKPLIESAHLQHRDSWEQARLMAYMTAQVNSTKKLKLTDIIKFAWDEEEKNTSVTNDDAERLKIKAEKYRKYIYGTGSRSSDKITS